MPHKRGRPSKYERNVLLAKLHEYALKYKGQTIKLSRLAKETNVPRHIWEHNMRKEIDIYNADLIAIDEKELRNLPQINFFDLVDKYENDPSKLEIVLNEMNYTTQASRANSIKYDTLQNKYSKLERMNEKCKKILEEQEEQIKYLQHRIKELFIYSYSELKSKEYGIKANIGRLNNRNDGITSDDMKLLSKKLNDEN